MVSENSLYSSENLTPPIVGFNTLTTPGDQLYTYITPYFTEVDDEDNFSMSSFISEPSQGDSIQFFDEEGELGDQLSYLYKAPTTGAAKVWGWFLNGKTYAPDYKIPRGTSFWMCTDGAFSINMSGAVNLKEKTYVIPGGQLYVTGGNCFPVKVKLSDIVFTPAPTQGDSIQFFTEEGELGDQLSYLYKAPTSGAAKVWGWFLNGKTYAPDFELEPGQLFWGCFDGEGTMTFPAVQLNK